MKICGRCGKEKLDSDFYYHKKHSDGKNSYCIPCTKKASNEWYHKNKHKDKVKEKQHSGHIKRTYGITSEQYSELFKKQNGCCAVCSRHQETLTNRLSVDHNHKTGAIRGLLCTNCNHRLIGRHTDGELLRRMADYVESETGWFVPKKRRRKRKKA